MADLQSVVDQHSTIPDEAIRDAAKSIRVAQGRQRFSLGSGRIVEVLVTLKLISSFLAVRSTSSSAHR